MPASSQGSTVSFGGNVAELLSWDVTPATAETTDATDYASLILGAGGMSRVVKQFDCTAVSPGTATITFLGAAGFTEDLVGSVGLFSVSSNAGSISLQAILMKFTVTGSVGELVKGSAEFQFTGA